MTRSHNSRRGAAPKGKRGYDFGSARLFGWHEATSYNKFRTHRLERRANRQAPERELAEHGYVDLSGTRVRWGDVKEWRDAEPALPFGAGLEETDEERFWCIYGKRMDAFWNALEFDLLPSDAEYPDTAPPLTGWAAHPHADVLCGGEEDCR